jgi:hypothetical protein
METLLITVDPDGRKRKVVTSPKDTVRMQWFCWVVDWR